jgi:hypothetical protein
MDQKNRWFGRQDDDPDWFAGILIIPFGMDWSPDQLEPAWDHAC